MKGANSAVIGRDIDQITLRRRGRPKKCVLEAPLDFSSSSHLWDMAKLVKNGKGYSYRYIWDPALKITHTRMEHILVWERVNRKSIPQGYCIHHRDCDPTNNKNENLLCIPVVFHLELHAQLRRATLIHHGLALEVDRQRIIEQFVSQIDELEEIWALVHDQITEHRMAPWVK